MTGIATEPAGVRVLDKIASKARTAAQGLALTSSAVKDSALVAMASALESSTGPILAANTCDLADARASNAPDFIVDRLTLTEQRISSIAASLRAIAGLPDPVGETMDGWKRPNGLDIRRVRVPLGVIAVIYEARPNVTCDVVGLCVKSGNAAILRGSASAARSNRAIVDALTPAALDAGLISGAFQLVDDPGRESARALMRMRGAIDLLIPRGGPNLIAQVIENATVPFVIDGDGNCHVYVDAVADLDMATEIVVNAKVSRPSVCNSAEKLLVHRDVAAAFLPVVCAALWAEGVELRGDELVRAVVPDVLPASDDDWSKEYLGLTMAIRVVDSLPEAVAHIRRYGSGHTEAIVTGDIVAARTFVAACPSAVVMVNASTRFTDGEEFGFGAEIGNSTQRLHARGPMGLRELTTYRYEVWGSGQIRT
ncbi:MAG TPA: glutamate-5-semialdehyde dehydrogenase [Chloroflexota bacterium]|nr:glutamate-5-semialdehyde dehydrogenase [Chloroflexota bacterium]